MKKNEIIAKVTSAVNTATIKVKKHSPEILVVAGVVGTVASAVMACKATTKLSTVLEEHKKMWMLCMNALKTRKLKRTIHRKMQRKT